MHRTAESQPTRQPGLALLLLALLTPLFLVSWGCAAAVKSADVTPTQPTTPTTPGALAVAVSSLPSGTLQQAFSATLSATGGTVPYTWSISAGALPAGLTLSSGGQISGTPTASGSFSFTVKVTDSSAPAQSATANLSITVAATASSVQVTTASLPGGTANSVYPGATLAASGGTTPYSWSIASGALPTGLTLSGGGQISGTPTASGTFSFTVQVTDSSSPKLTATAKLSITVAAASAPGQVQISTTSLPSGQVGTAYSSILSATGGATPYSWTVSSGSLPTGLTLSASGQISGTPTVSGMFTFTVKVTDSSAPAQTATAGLSINVAAAAGGGGGTGNATLVLCPNNGETGNNANCVQPPTLTFGKQGAGTPSAPLTISVNNCATPNVAACTGSGTLTLGSPYFTISGANASDFANTGAGTCSNGATVASGSDCTIVLKFTPSQGSGANESATLTVNSNSQGNPQTMSLTGTSATVTTISSCQTLNSNTNYQLTANVSAAGTCFTVGGSNTDLNLNGFTVTYCTASSGNYVGGVMMNGNPSSNTTVHNGTINEGAGTCSGETPSNGYGSGAVVASSDGSSSATVGTTVFNLVTTVKVNRAKVVFEENAGDGGGQSTTIHDVIYTDNDVYSCGDVGCRDLDQSYPIVVDQSGNAGPSQFYNITGTGSPQGGMVTTAANSVFKNNYINPGTTTATNTNGFAYQNWGPGSTLENNLVAGSGEGGSCTSCRGVQVSSVNNRAVSGVVVENNHIFTTALNNDAEYPDCATAQEAASYGMQINTAGSPYDLSNNTFQNNQVVVTAKACAGFGFSWSGATNDNGPNQTKNNSFTCTMASGAAAGVTCAGIRMDANQYSPHPDNAVMGSGDTYVGDTSAIYIWYDGTPTWTCSQCTFGKGNNAIGGWVMLDYYGGGGSGGSSDPMYLIDPTFTNGATKDSNNLAAWASNNGGSSFSYTVQWTYTVTVKGETSGDLISGASVTATDVRSGQECNGTTNGNGVFSCVVNDTKYGASGGNYTVTSSNPFSFSISASGCTTATYSESILSTTSETKTLPGC